MKKLNENEIKKVVGGVGSNGAVPQFQPGQLVWLVGADEVNTYATQGKIEKFLEDHDGTGASYLVTVYDGDEYGTHSSFYMAPEYILADMPLGMKEYYYFK